MHRVALFVPSLVAGGAERVMLRLADTLGRMQGVEVDLVVTRCEGTLVPEVPEHVSLFELGSGRTVLAVPALVRYLRARRPEALLCTMLGAIGAGIVAGSVARTGARIIARQPNLFGRQFLGEAHAGNLVARIGGWLLPRWLRRADSVIAVSDDVYDEILACGVEASRVHCIPNPLPMAWVRGQAAAPLDHPWLGAEADIPVIVAAGRMVRQKGYASLLDAVACCNEHRPLRCIILGDGVLRPVLESRCHELGLDDRVDMPGVMTNPYRYFARADVYVSSSAWEGMPNVILEALACGAPVVATDCPGGSRQVLTSVHAGRLVAVDDAKGMAAAIHDVLKDRASFVANTDALAEHYGDITVARRYLDVMLVSSD